MEIVRFSFVMNPTYIIKTPHKAATMIAFIFSRILNSDKSVYNESEADVLVQPYKTATQSGVTPLAMHFNLPMIVTQAGGLKEMVVDGETGVVKSMLIHWPMESCVF